MFLLAFLGFPTSVRSPIPFLQLMHALLGAICCMFGMLWLRALVRVRSNVCQRAALSRGVNSVLAGLDPHTRDWVVANVVALQAAVRRRQAMVLAQRMHAMDAYVPVGMPNYAW